MNVNEEYSDTVFKQLDFKKEILESDKRLFMLIAGVGAGKNYWVKKLTERGHGDKGYKECGYKVLLITSRRATADAQAIKLDADKKFHFSKLYEDEGWWDDDPPEHNKVVCCTNSYIEMYLKNLYDPNNPKTHVWNMFDFIILDEAHSLVCDATFSEAPFHVLSFLRHAHRNSDRCRVVFMSGTPHPIEWLYSGANKDKVKVIDLYDKCRHLEPKRFILRARANLTEVIAEKINAGKKIIYFATTSDSMCDLVKGLRERGIPYEKMGISYSDDEERDKKFPKELVDKREHIMVSLRDNELIPPEIAVFITTSKNKEGINIENSDIGIMVVESHIRDEVRQMAGRVRNGLESLVLITDAPQHRSQGDKFAQILCKNCIDKVNATADKCWPETRSLSNREIENSIKKVEGAFRYIRYDYLAEKFGLYNGRLHGDLAAEAEERVFQELLREWENPNYYGENYGYSVLKKWFPYAKTTYFLLRTYEEHVKCFLEERVCDGEIIDRAQRDALAEDLNALAYRYDKKGFKNLGAYIKAYGYAIEEPVGMRKGDHYIIRKTGENFTDL